MNKKKEFDEITVALICYEEKEQLALVLGDIKRQSFLKSIKEVLLLQNARPNKEICQETKKIALSFKKELPLVFLSSKENHLGLARSQLTEKAQSEWLAFTDSDCRLKEDWLECLVKNAKKSQQSLKEDRKQPLQKIDSNKKQPSSKNSKHKSSKKVVAVGGPNRLPENKFWKKMLNLSLNFPVGHGFSPQAWRPPKARSVSHIPTTNGLFLKSAILSVGNFSSQFPYAGEDLEIGARLKTKGELFLFPKPLVINDYASSYLESLKRLFVFGLVQNQNRGLLFYLSLLFFPLFILSVVLSLLWTLGWVFIFDFSELFLPALTFLSCYFLLLLSYSLKACVQLRKLSPLLLVFFWLFQHITYSSGVCFGFFSKK